MVWFLRGICKQCISRLYVYTIFKLSKPRYGITHAAAYIKILFVFCKRDFHILSIDDCFLFALRTVEREVP